VLPFDPLLEKKGALLQIAAVHLPENKKKKLIALVLHYWAPDELLIFLVSKLPSQD
jgi:hypothetical protein